MASDFPAEPGYRQDLARSELILGNLLAARSRTDDAERAYHDALTLYEQLAAEFPTVSEYLQELADSHYSLGRLFYDTRRKELAEDAYKQSLAINQRLADTYPQVPGHRSKLATIHTILGILYQSTNRAELARQAYQEALLINQRLVKAHPEVPAYQQALAASFSNLARLDKESGRMGSAERGFLEARIIVGRLVENYPQVPEYELYLAATNNNLASVYHVMQRADLAEQTFQQAQVIYQRLADGYPEVADYTIQLGGISWNLGHLLRDERGKPQEALDCYARPIAPLEALLRKDPQQAKAREVLFVLVANRAIAFALLGRHAEAAREIQMADDIDQGQSRGDVRYFGGDDIRLYQARVLVLAEDHRRAAALVDELIRSKRLAGSQHYSLAITYALAASAGQQDAKLSESERAGLSERYAANAVELLRKAQAAGHFRNPAAIEGLRSAKELAVLRSREDFQKLVQELEDQGVIRGK